MNNIFVVVPTLDPDEKIMQKFIDDLQKEFKHILVVNDGSKKNHDKFFKNLENNGVEVIYHYRNLGKGRAIKNAFNYLLNEHPKIIGAVTCDSDGQHSVADIKKCAMEIQEDKDELILGVRDFDLDIVPSKSKWGNKITRNIFKIFIGLDISDTKTGLRGFNRNLMTAFLGLAGERYEYETNMLIMCKQNDIPIKEVEIATIYLNNNVNSHFNPLKDAVLIYRLFLKYFLASFSSFLVDIILFSAILGILQINSKILAATILARIVSSIYNYIINSNLVFKNMSLFTLLKYYVLVIVQMFMSGCFVTYFASLIPKVSVILIKIVIDSLIWVINLVIQREFVFKGENK